MNHYQKDKVLASKDLLVDWFCRLRDNICSEFEKIEIEYAAANNKPFELEILPDQAKFNRKNWNRDGGGGGEISLMKGNVFEKVGVNFSCVFGNFSESFRHQIPGTKESPEFWACGISLVAHMRSPLVPAVHMNTRFISTAESWFGGGADLNPIYPKPEETKAFHQALKNACDAYDLGCYDNFKKKCDEYFFIKHRNESRGVGGIFYDYLNSGDFEKDFSFTGNVGLAFLDVFPRIVRTNMFSSWTDQDREYQLIKRGRYTEFNLIYDRGTKFGLMTNGNPEAVLMSLPPVAKWD